MVSCFRSSLVTAGPGRTPTMKAAAALVLVAAVTAAAPNAGIRSTGLAGENKIASVNYETDGADQPTEITKICMTNGIPEGVTKQIRLVYIDASGLQTDYFSDYNSENDGDCVSFEKAPKPANDGDVTYIFGYAINQDAYSVIDSANFKFEKAGATFTCGDVLFERTNGGEGCIGDTSDLAEGSNCYKEVKNPGENGAVCTPVTDDASKSFEYCQLPENELTGTKTDFIDSLGYDGTIKIKSDQTNAAEEAIVALSDGTSQCAKVSGDTVTLEVVPSTSSYAVCRMANDDTFTEDSINDIEIKVTKEQTYYEFGFYYEGQGPSSVGTFKASVLKDGSPRDVTVDCSNLQPKSRCYGFIEADEGSDLQVSYFEANVEDNTVIYSEP